MAEEDKRLSQTLDEMNRDVTLKLVPYGGRVFVNNADINRVDECSIELKCWFSPAAFSLDVTIGEEEHSHVTHYSDEDEGEQESSQAEQDIGWQLGNVPIMLTLYRVDEKWLNESAEKSNGSPVLGRFHYYPRINTADGVVKDKRPTVTAWTCLGADNFALLRSRLIDFKKHDFEIGLSVVFPHGTVESQGFMGKRIKWNGEGELPVKSASIVWRKEDWSSDFHRKERMFDDKPREAELPFDPPREHIEVMDATKRIEAALGRLVTPIWLAVAALIVLAFLRR